MARTKRKVKPLPTIWSVPDELWGLIEPILKELDPVAKAGRKRIDARKALDGIIYQAVLQRPFDSSYVPAMWIRKGVLDRMWALLVEPCEELDGVDWQ